VGRYQLGFLRRKSLPKCSRRDSAQFLHVRFLHCARVTFDGAAQAGQVHVGSSLPRELGLLLVFDDVHRSFLSGGRAAADADVLSYQLRLGMFTESLVLRDEPACPHTADFT
jgi:hypothetical protein